MALVPLTDEEKQKQPKFTSTLGIMGGAQIGAPQPSYFENSVKNKLNPNRGTADSLLGGLFTQQPSQYRTDMDSTMSTIKSQLASLGSYDPNADPLYQTYKDGLTKDADKAYTNINSEYLGNQSGNFNSAALQIASSAKNDLLDKANNSVVDFADRQFSRNQKMLNEQYGLLDALGKLDTTEYNKGRDTVSDTGMVNGQYTQSGLINSQTIESNNSSALARKAATIAAANYNDIQEYINSLPEGDPLIPYLQAERKKKIDTENANKAATEKETYDRTMESEKFGLDKWYKEAQINNMNVDNLRQASGGSSGSSKSGSSSQVMGADDLTAARIAAGESGNPPRWLADNAQYMDADLLKAANAMFGNAPLNSGKILSNLTPEQRDYYNGMRDIFVNGSRDGIATGYEQSDRADIQNPVYKKYKDDPYAAKKELESSEINQKMPGYAFDLLINELDEKIKQKPAGDLDSLAREMMESKDKRGNSDMMYWLKNNMSRLSKDQYEELYKIASLTLI